ncbi:MAG: M1 family metallopeptidase [Bryobacteraceae bacterium]|nr:M1 family metallopeptidase [Bryobacteraceae bacterium]
MRLGLLLLAAVLPASARLASPIASYDIRASLDPRAHRIAGEQTLLWLNDSPDAVPNLRFHLYMNAFRNTRSTFYLESGGQLRGDRAARDSWGWIQIHSLRLEDGTDLTPSIRCVSPDDNNPDDCTVIDVPVPAPVRPAQALRLHFRFTVQLPRVFARTGYHGDFHLAGQWFPKIGVWETRGFRGRETPGWNCHQFHANSEFYANFGDYRVEITVPSHFVVGATGEMVRRTDNPAARTSTYVFVQPSVTDFAWTAQPGFLRLERLFEARREVSRQEIAATARLHGIPEQDAELSDVRMIVLLQPEHAEQAERHFRALSTAIRHFGLWYGRYPYRTITVVDPPYGAGGAAGMEYPTFITAGTSFRLPPDVLSLEMVTVHEFGHQFWMQLVASNEFEESWLDEGFNTYSTSKIMDKAYGGTALPLSIFGRNFASFLRLPRLTQSSLSRIAHLSYPVRDPLALPAWQFYDSASYSVSSYMRTAVALETLERLIGPDTMARAMRVYHQRWRFRHPSSRDFQQAVEEVSGRSLEWFFSQFVFGARRLDYAVSEIGSRRISTPAGVFESGGKQWTVSAEEAEKQDRQSEKKGRKPLYESWVKIERLGDATVPQELEVRFRDGRVERRSFDGAARWVKFTFTHPAEIESAQLDPRRIYQLDQSFSNNGRTARLQTGPAAQWLPRLLFWAQNALLWLSALA